MALDKFVPVLEVSSSSSLNAAQLIAELHQLEDVNAYQASLLRLSHGLHAGRNLPLLLQLCASKGSMHRPSVFRVRWLICWL